MNVSLRSQMVAGVAALGAAAVAVTPITQPDLLPTMPRISAAVELSGLANPVVALIDVAGLAYDLTFDQVFLNEDLAWPESFYGVEFLYAPLNYGIIPDLANQFSTGPLVGLVNNLSGYAFAAGAGALVLAEGAADSIFNTPFALVDAVQELIAGDPEAALQTLITGIVQPIQYGLETVLAATGYIVDNVLQNFQTVVTSTLPYLVKGLLDSTIASVTFIANSLVDTATSFVNNLVDLNFEGAWNDVVNGILGSAGTLGQIVEQTIGIGQLETIDDVPTITVPSLRSVLTSELQRLGGQKWWEDGGITNDPFYIPEPPAAAAVSAPVAAAAVESAPVVESAPAVEVEAPAAVQAEAEAPAVSVTEVEEPAVAVTEVEAVEAAEPVAAAAVAGDSDNSASSDSPKKSSHRVGKRAAAN